MRSKLSLFFEAQVDLGHIFRHLRGRWLLFNRGVENPPTVSRLLFFLRRPRTYLLPLSFLLQWLVHYRIENLKTISAKVAFVGAGPDVPGRQGNEKIRVNEYKCTYQSQLHQPHSIVGTTYHVQYSFIQGERDYISPYLVPPFFLFPRN